TSCADQPRGRISSPPRSADGVPAVGKWNNRPGELVVVGGFRRPDGSRRIGHEVLLRLDCRSHGIQQSVEFSFAHRALPARERTISKVVCLHIEAIVQIVSIRRWGLTWLPNC